MANENPDYEYLITNVSNPNITPPQNNLLGSLVGIYGISMSKYLSKPGDMNFSIRMDNPLMTYATIENLTRPGERSIWVYRDGNVVWNGIIWSRTYQSDGKSLSMTARTYDAYLQQLIFPLNYSYFQFPHNIITNIWSQIPLVAATYMLGRYPREFAVQGTLGGFGPGYTLNVVGYQAPYFSALVDQAIKWGGEYRVQASEYGFFNGRMNYLEVGMWPAQTFFPGSYFTVGIQPPNKRHVFQYPGSIKKFWWPESVSVTAGGASHIYVVGKGTTVANTPFQLMANQSLVKHTEMVTTSRRLSIDTLTAQADVTAAATIAAPLYEVPVTNPTFELDVGHTDVFLPDLDVGDYFDYILLDKLRFPLGRKGQARCNGWTLQPPASDSPEQFGITIVDTLSDITQAGI